MAAKKKATKKTTTGKKAPAKKAAVKKAKKAGDATTGKKRVVFKYDGADAGVVTLVGTFNNWDPGNGSMKKSKSGVWSKTMYLAPGTYEYKFLADDNWTTDPECEETVPNEHGTLNSLLRVG